MKRFYFALSMVALSASLFTSCLPTFYQVQTTSPGENIKEENGFYTFENEDCAIYYDFWSLNGNTSFIFKNKTDKYITINRELCFLIKNGRAIPYYEEKEYTYSKSIGNNASATKSYGEETSVSHNSMEFFLGTIDNSGNTVSASLNRSVTYSSTAAQGYSVCTKEPKTIIVPAKSIVCVNGFSISGRYRNCNFKERVEKDSPHSIKFSMSESPLTFTNVINYKVEGEEENCTINNKFYISDITNYNQKDITTDIKETNCFTGLYELKKVFDLRDYHRSFYIEYSQGDAKSESLIIRGKHKPRFKYDLE